MIAEIKKRLFAGAPVAAFLILFLTAGVARAESQWTHLFTKDGIEVYATELTGTPVRAFKGIGHVNADMAAVAAVIQDIPAYPRWVARCLEARVIKKIDNDTSVFYSVVDSPPPYQDRDMVLVNKTIYFPEKGMIEIAFDLADQELVPADDRYFRVKELSGEYLLESAGRDRTRITFVYRGNPGGNIPVTIADWVESRYYPHANIMGLREMVKERK
jgi:hypothetical protein